MSLQDDDTASIKSYGSHKNRMFKDESHKGSAETLDGEEKRDASKEERMDMERGNVYSTFINTFSTKLSIFRKFCSKICVFCMKIGTTSRKLNFYRVLN